MKRTVLGGAIAASIITVALVFTASAPAMASTPAPKSPAPKTLAEIQTAGAKATSDRITSLNREIPRISGNACITDSNKSTILGTLNADLTGMQDLASAIAADTDVSSAAAHYKSIFDDYRVYGVGIAQAHYAAAADCIQTKAIPALTKAQTKLAAALAGKYADKSTPEIEAKMADLAAQIAAATAAIDGVAAQALAVTPADYNANHAVLSSAKSSVSAAAAAVKLAKQDAQAVLAALK
jgi:hypothetical protein